MIFKTIHRKLVLRCCGRICSSWHPSCYSWLSIRLCQYPAVMYNGLSIILCQYPVVMYNGLNIRLCQYLAVMYNGLTIRLYQYPAVMYNGLSIRICQYPAVMYNGLSIGLCQYPAVMYNGLSIRLCQYPACYVQWVNRVVQHLILLTIIAQLTEKYLDMFKLVIQNLRYLQCSANEYFKINAEISDSVANCHYKSRQLYN